MPTTSRKKSASKRSSHAIKYQTLRSGHMNFRVGVRPGLKNGTPLFLFNGIGASIELLAPFMDDLPELTMISFDAPGIGGTDVPSLPYRPRHLAHAVADILDQLEVEEVHILGVSWGGGPAQEFAYRYPDRCKRLILAATSAGFVMVPGRPSAILRMANPRRYIDREYMDRIAGTLYGGSMRTNTVLREEHIARMRPPSGRGYYYQLLALAGWTSYHWLHKIRQPTLVLAGKHDPIIRPVNARILGGRIPNAEVVYVDCGHLFLLTRAKMLAPKLLSFLENTDE